MSREARMLHSDFEKRVLPELLRVVRRQVEVLDTMVEVFQDGQGLVPPPTEEELAAMRRGELPLTREAYLIGVFQRALIPAENLATDLRTAIGADTLRGVVSLQLTEAEFNAIAAGMERLRGRDERRG